MIETDKGTGQQTVENRVRTPDTLGDFSDDVQLKDAKIPDMRDFALLSDEEQADALSVLAERNLPGGYEINRSRVTWQARHVTQLKIVYEYSEMEGVPELALKDKLESASEGERGEIDELREAIDRNKDRFRRTFKIHLNPAKEALSEAFQRLVELIKEDGDIRNNIKEIKVNCVEGGDINLESGDLQVAPIVIYPVSGDKVEDSLATVYRILKALKNKMSDLDERSLPLLTHTPRYNYPISRLIHVAQSSGYFKGYLDYLRLNDEFFDPYYKHAFFREDSRSADRTFGLLRTKEAIAYFRGVSEEGDSPIFSTVDTVDSVRSVKVKKGFAAIVDRVKGFLISMRS